MPHNLLCLCHDCHVGPEGVHAELRAANRPVAKLEDLPLFAGVRQ